MDGQAGRRCIALDRCCIRGVAALVRLRHFCWKTTRLLLAPRIPRRSGGNRFVLPFGWLQAFFQSTETVRINSRARELVASCGILGLADDWLGRRSTHYRCAIALLDSNSVRSNNFLGKLCLLLCSRRTSSESEPKAHLGQSAVRFVI